MGSTRGAASVASILLVLGVLGVVVAGATIWPLVAAAGERTELRQVTAKVLERRPCGPKAQGDRVEVRVGGETRTGTFSGCGHFAGTELKVLVPARARDGFVAVPADSARSGLEDLTLRTNLVLVTLAAVAGGGYGVLLAGRR
ncbi:hypothetical protein [Saccharopolyspora griseoalba]|uniref:DUF3592 domain-containing protein n=1 Tax=Saccharopolyspora griseoalba TaxID=1431848 RepID=A0ABW2LL35_9PSEU